MKSLTLNPAWLLTQDGEIKFVVSSDANPDGELISLTVDRHDLLEALREDVRDAFNNGYDEVIVDWCFFFEELKVFLEDANEVLKHD